MPCGVQCVGLLPHSSRVLCSILSTSYCLSGFPCAFPYTSLKMGVLAKINDLKVLMCVYVCVPGALQWPAFYPASDSNQKCGPFSTSLFTMFVFLEITSRL